MSPMVVAALVVVGAIIAGVVASASFKSAAPLVGAGLLFSGYGMILVGGVGFLYVAAQAGIFHVILCFFVPFYSLIFLLRIGRTPGGRSSCRSWASYSSPAGRSV